ncbi:MULTISPECIES: glycosyltransferase family 4 protein [Burkholderia cepacia complex]|uniref:Glycosyl transferase n=1 Tax=Burkholderia cenocepacia TaxID=95486 RepID=A0A1V2W220_9BURK|nr:MULTISPECIES: glycosyltransferase family 4 protein [Burkholderia cepacia complex]KVE85619.1 glycosyl transferase [Burkholderia cepacia]MBR8250230.1 glycosyltransferase family 4 protein [Burkholderia cenocepacia]MBR8286541.1 glycosyltransferase family 4 protein [Burkholderia cenocepacia]MBR8499429.1 glycosyltransferase family 4 protein [Burkholderia cenocepacia]MCA8156677.1 glycosyltransferase family 4 protein [Burkholderia contaminans]
MRIAQIAPLHEAVPPKLYGGTERVVSYLTDALVQLGHDVTLFASGDSITDATLRACWPTALRLDSTIRDPIAPHFLMLEQVRAVAHEFDILHFHLDYLPFSLFGDLGVPFVTTLHGRLDLAEIHPVFAQHPDTSLISISDAQRLPMPHPGWTATVQHGLPNGLLTPQANGDGDYLAFLGRICPEKGVDAAIRIATEAGLPLKIAAKVDKADVAYFEREIAPLLQQANVEFIGEINERQKPDFLSNARAMLLPIDWPEPFGLVMIEAMACGTPTIAFRRGSVPEVIDDGVTGYVVDTVAQAVDAVERSKTLSRSAIRRVFEQRFDARRMANDYVDVYREVIGARVPEVQLV